MIKRYQQELLFILMLCAVAFLTGGAYYIINWKYVLYRQAENQLALHQFKSAAELYEKAIAKGIDSYQAYLHLADAYTAENQFDQAAATYRRYLEKYPNDKKARLMLARVLSYAGRFEESVEEYRKGIGQTHEKNDGH